MNGAQSLLRTLVGAGVEVCFANPGTSEMHFVAALEDVPDMRGVLGLAEGVVTGAADGYGRMHERPAVTLLHLGPGMANGLANLHNARRAATPIVNVVGDHALTHKGFDAPLESDIDAAAGTVSTWVRRSEDTASVGADAAEAVAAATAPPAGVATLLLPADVSWSDGGAVAPPVATPGPRNVPESVLGPIAEVVASGEATTLLLGGTACRERGLVAASRIAEATGVRVLVETFPARLERGAGRPSFGRLAYLAESATGQLADSRHLVLAGARSPVSFFAYPGRASDLVPEGTTVHRLASREDDVAGALEALADLLAPEGLPALQQEARPDIPSGELTLTSWADVIGALLPPDAIVCDEANTSGAGLAAATAGAPRHDWLTLTGGAIGQGLPLAVGAAVACPDRHVIALEADGSAMYTIQALWTMAREGLDITTVVLNNGAYAILRMELQRVGAGVGGPMTESLLDLSRPTLDFVSLATGMGVPASRATTGEELAEQFAQAVARSGPHLIEAVVPPLL